MREEIECAGCDKYTYLHRPGRLWKYPGEDIWPEDWTRAENQGGDLFWICPECFARLVTKRDGLKEVD